MIIILTLIIVMGSRGRMGAGEGEEVIAGSGGGARGEVGRTGGARGGGGEKWGDGEGALESGRWWLGRLHGEFGEAHSYLLETTYVQTNAQGYIT